MVPSISHFSESRLPELLRASMEEGKAAGMQVIAVPSMRSKDAPSRSCCYTPLLFSFSVSFFFPNVSSYEDFIEQLRVPHVGVTKFEISCLHYMVAMCREPFYLWSFKPVVRPRICFLCWLGRPGKHRYVQDADVRRIEFFNDISQGAVVSSGFSAPSY